TKAASLEPENISVQDTIARFHYSHKNIDAANKIISNILSERPQYYPARMLKSEILVSEKKFTEALQLLDALEKEEPKAPRTHYFKGLCFIGTGNYDQAKTVVARAVELNPGYFKARMLLADIYLHEQAFDPAHKEASAALELNPGDYQARIIRANAAVGLRKFEDAEKDYLKLIETAPENPMAYYQLGLLKSALKENDASMRYLKAAYEKNNKLIDVFLQIVRNHVIQKEYEIAHELCKNQIQVYEDQKPLIAVVYNIQSGIYLAQKDILKAKETLSKAIELSPDYLPPYETLAKLFLAENNKEKAIEQYTIILEKNPKLPVPHMMIGTIYDSAKEYDKAAEHYQKALDINPEFAPAANNLAYHLLQRTDKIDEALRLAKIAKAKFPEDPGIMDTLGLAYYRKELYGNAANEFLDALKKMPDNATVNYHLGLAYAKKGDKDLALAALKKTLELNSRFEEAKAAEQLISELQK
nr:tetratricopeptide repeat protein [Desulfobacteraceae bacterium]